jgi:putative membrane protein insertion efficiency factor
MRNVIRRMAVLVAAVVSGFLIAGVRCYQIVLRPLLPAVCRFTPSCSEYFIEAVRKYGPFRGGWRGVCRIARCHPWHPGGHDPP